jgi:hypothetical protein
MQMGESSTQKKKICRAVQVCLGEKSGAKKAVGGAKKGR